jgi:hypothetical protein
MKHVIEAPLSPRDAKEIENFAFGIFSYYLTVIAEWGGVLVCKLITCCSKGLIQKRDIA